VNQLFKKIEGIKFPNLVNKTLSVPDFISVSFNLTDLKISNLKADPDTPLLDLKGNDEAVLQIKGFSGNVTADYMFITDPPILADIGQIHFESDNTTFKLDATTIMDTDNILNVTINELGLEMDPFVLHFDGISDTSDVISRFLTFGGNVIADRLQSMSHYDPAVSKLNNLLNTLIELLPDEIDIPGTPLYLEGGISDKLKIVEDKYMKLPLDASIQNKDYPYGKQNTCQFGDVVESDYQIETFLSEYVLDSGMWALFKAGYFVAKNISVPVITTTEIDLAVLGKLSRNGFKHGQPCVVDISVINNSPDIEITKAKGLHFTG